MRAGVFAAFFLLTPALFSQTLKTIRPIVSQSEDGPPLSGGESLSSGELAFFSFQVDGYKVNAGDKVNLTAHIQAFDPRGIPVAPRDEVVIGDGVSREDREWKPKVRSQLGVPPIPVPGNYTIRFDVTDQLTHQTASGETAFLVKGKTVAPGASLVIRNFGLYRTQDEETPLKVAAYRPGDMLWVRFDITGYKFGEQNSIDVSYDVAVLTGDGKQLFSQEEAAVEKSQAYYPQPWVPAEFNLSLQSTMNPGAYSVVITAHDGSGQTAASKVPFQVER
jgi:hypothetical protein